MKFILAASLAVLLACLSHLPSAYASDFDYYKLAVTYSSSFCANTENHGSHFAQCRAGHQNHFALHGFWPQNENDWPEYCSLRNTFVPSRIAKKFRDLIPDKKALQYQWRKHGACSGMRPEEYFNLARQAISHLSLAKLENALEENSDLGIPAASRILLQSNPNLNNTGFTFHCENGGIQDIRFCFTKALESRTCLPARDQGCPGL